MNYKTIYGFLLIMAIGCHAFSQSAAEKIDPPKKIKIYLLGTFHFRQTDEGYDVRDDKHQKSIIELCSIIEKQNPDKVFVERQPEFEFKNKLNDLYKQFLNGNSKLTSKNEIDQVGFRVAKNLGHSRVYQCDNPGMYGKYYKASLQYARANGQMDIMDAKAIGTIPRYDDLIDEDSVMANSSLLDYMRWINSDEVMNSSHASYITTFTQIGSTDFYNYDEDSTLIGAELVANWYRRNIMIYSKIINQLDYTEDAIFLIMGGDHIPILRNLFRDNPWFEVVKVEDWLL